MMGGIKVGADKCSSDTVNSSGTSTSSRTIYRVNENLSCSVSKYCEDIESHVDEEYRQSRSAFCLEFTNNDMHRIPWGGKFQRGGVPASTNSLCNESTVGADKEVLGGNHASLGGLHTMKMRRTRNSTHICASVFCDQCERGRETAQIISLGSAPTPAYTSSADSSYQLERSCKWPGDQVKHFKCLRFYLGSTIGMVSTARGNWSRVQPAIGRDRQYGQIDDDYHELLCLTTNVHKCNSAMCSSCLREKAPVDFVRSNHDQSRIMTNCNSDGEGRLECNTVGFADDVLSTSDASDSLPDLTVEPKLFPSS